MFQGTTPVSLDLTTDREHELRLSEPGFQTRVERLTLRPEEQRQLELALSPEYGVVFLASQPADASLKVDGRPAGSATRRLRLTTRPAPAGDRQARLPVQDHHSHPPGRLQPDPGGGAQEPANRPAVEATPSSITSAAGQRLLLVRPGGPFRMGASRREAGRRANESQRLVAAHPPVLPVGKRSDQRRIPTLPSRPRLRQRRRCRPRRRPAAGGQPELGRRRPLLQLAQPAGRPASPPTGKWAAICGRWPQPPPATASRARREWAYVARVQGRSEPARYPWAGSYPPKAAVGNFADARIADTLAEVVPELQRRLPGQRTGGQLSAQPDRLLRSRRQRGGMDQRLLHRLPWRGRTPGAGPDRPRRRRPPHGARRQLASRQHHRAAG